MMPDTLRQVVFQPASRPTDKPLASLLPHHTFVQLHSVLAARRLFWLSNVLEVTCTKLAHRNTLHLNTPDWELLAKALAPKHQLLHTYSYH